MIPRVQFPEQQLRPGASYILNLDRGNYSRGGTHWVCCRVSNSSTSRNVSSPPGKLIYFDSFGGPPPSEVVTHAWASDLGVIRTDLQLQGFGTQNCGPRCLAVLRDLAEAPNDVARYRDIAQEA